ncbi:DUF4238 domain-containing protein [Streptomyces sp. MBT65]|uniref:DUF4238 domain-containing protein n=1 Tax=Streptomyces sp. MBT65 TaxID=1488395 RepID=UPI00190CD30A|nr:DUF4238 domain-containing protein [Streptomyces sp. MBT65]MBK3576476.1 DUF4238 domain-containing protein [Streptomyces sp. MBT65]
MGTAQQISRQHLVSQVLLRQFTVPGPKGSGRQLLPFDLRNPRRRHKLKGTRACGWAENFVAFDSVSAEELWCAVEQRVPAALSAVHAGTPFVDPLHAAALHDLVVLHYVRSYHYRRVHIDAFARARVGLVGQLVRNYPAQSGREALRETGLHLTGSDSLGAFAERLIDRSAVVRDHASGKIFRTSIEDTFYKVRAMASTWRLEVLMPETGQFLIGDNPAVTLCRDGTNTSYGMAFGDANTLVLPIGPGHLLALGPENVMGTVPRSVVDELNTVQVHAADRYVYMHPRSGLEAFARAVAEQQDKERL